MSGFIKIPERASLALHTMAYLASDPEQLVNTKTVAELLGVSEAHLSKVMQRLTAIGMIRSVRGPKGGFSLARPAAEITLIEIFEALEGPFDSRTCLLDSPGLGCGICFMGNLWEYEMQIVSYMRKTKLSEINTYCNKESSNES